MIASIEKPSNYLTWETGKQNELKFWQDFFATKGGSSMDDGCHQKTRCTDFSNR